MKRSFKLEQNTWNPCHRNASTDIVRAHSRHVNTYQHCDSSHPCHYQTHTISALYERTILWMRCVLQPCHADTSAPSCGRTTGFTDEHQSPPVSSCSRQPSFPYWSCWCWNNACWKLIRIHSRGFQKSRACVGSTTPVTARSALMESDNSHCTTRRRSTSQGRSCRM